MVSGRRVLVTGGAGFIGSHVVDELLAAGDEVRVLDCLHPFAHGARPEHQSDGAEYRWADVRDQEAIEAALAGVDAVSHQAAIVGLGADIADIADYAAHNSWGTACLLRAMHVAGFDGPLVLASSMVVYGEGRYRCPEHGLVAPAPRTAERLVAREFEPPCPVCGAPLAPEAVPETAPLEPRSVYAATKVNQEHLCEAYARETGARLVALRYHNVYGSRMPRETPYAGVASIFRSALERGEAPSVFEDGAQLRDFVEVRDVARANRLALEPRAEATGAFNIASGRPRTVGELAAELAGVSGGPEPEVTGEFRLGDVRHVYASAERARERLDFEAGIPFEAGVAAFASAPLRSVARVGAEAPAGRGIGS
jgi:dTDP-L-rhamnose 4-epimerase